MGNVNGKDLDNGHERLPAERMQEAPPEIPSLSTAPFILSPQVPVAPLQRPTDSVAASNHPWINDSNGPTDALQEKGIPIIITWNQGGNDVSVEGSWDNWSSRKAMQKSGKDHVILLVLPSGIYHYKVIVDGEARYIPDLPYMTDERGQVANLLDVHDYVPESLDSVCEFELPPSPRSSYGEQFPGEEEFAKEPPSLPPQVLVSVLGAQNTEAERSPPKPQHVVLDHLFIEKGWASQSLLALGLTHRFHSKYVTVVLYKPLKR